MTALIKRAFWFSGLHVIAVVLAADCTTPTQIPDQTISAGSPTFLDNNALKAAGVVINGAANVKFVAGNCVELRSGFSATAGTAPTTFQAWVETLPSVTSVSPASGSGSSQIFTYTIQSPSGYNNLAHVFVLFHTALVGVNGCYVYYSPSAGQLFLRDDAGEAWLGPVSLGSSNSASNSACTMHGAGSSASGSGNQLQLFVNLTFSPQFAGAKNHYVKVYNLQGLDSDWQQYGTWTVTSVQQYLLTTSASPADGGSVTPVSNWYPSGQVVQVTANANNGYQFAGFSGDLTGTANPQSLTMNGSKTVTATFTNTITSTNLADFQSCIGAAGVVANCVLAPGRYPVNAPLRLQRSGITVRGGGGPGDTTLYRNADIVEIMVADGNTSEVTIENLTIDGNRYGPGLGLACLHGNALYFDLDLRTGGTFTVRWLNFINAPGWALIMKGYGSSVSTSNFGQGGYGIAPDGTLRALTGPESATRSTAIWIEGSQNGAWYNAISYAGTAAINLLGSHQYAYGNLLYHNRYEISDGSQGGQLFLDPGSSAATVTANVIDGAFWPEYLSGPPSLATGCLLPNNAQFNAGVEAYGWDHYFFNNEIEKHTGSGMQLAGSEPTGRITISSENPYDPSDTPRYIEMNRAGGIVFLGPNWSDWPVAAQGVTLYRVNVRNNARFDVTLDGISDHSSVGYYGTAYQGFAGDSCIIPASPDPPRYLGPVAGVPGINAGMPPPHPNTLSRPVPTSYGAYTANGGTCPDPGWPAQTPARSNIPGWRW